MTSNLLWTGQSEFCQCSHHITKHSTNRLLDCLWTIGQLREEYHCSGRCKCREFIPYRRTICIDSTGTNKEERIQ